MAPVELRNFASDAVSGLPPSLLTRMGHSKHCYAPCGQKDEENKAYS